MKLKLTTIFLSFILLFSCSNDDDSSADKTNEVNIRLSNSSNVRFENATFNNVNFGDIEPGETSEYKTFESSYAYGSVSITIDDQDYGWTPIDFVGEDLLESGNYTFVYSFDTILTDELIKD